MLIKLRFGFPEVVIGMLLAVAIFAIGMVFGSSQQSSPAAQSQHADNRPHESTNDQPDEGLWHWLVHDAAGFFTLWLVIVGGGQVVLFYVQLTLIRESLDDAKISADAAQDSARAANRAIDETEKRDKILRRPYIRRRRSADAGK